MATDVDTDIIVVPRTIRAMRLVYGRFIPGPAGVLPRLDEFLVAGRQLHRGTPLQETSSAQFVLGDVIVDKALRILAGRVGYQLRVGEIVDAFDSYADKFVSQTIVREEHVTAAFAIHLDEGWVLLEDAGERLPATSFVELLSDFVNEEVATDRQRIGAELLEVEESPWQFVARMDRIVSVRFSVTPSNPGKRWREMDEWLAAARARRLRQEYESEEGLAVPSIPGPLAEESPIGLGIAMTEAGFGEMDWLRIRGFFQGRSAVYEGRTGWSTLFEEIDAETVESLSKETESLLRQLVRQLSDAVHLGLLHFWIRAAPSTR